MLWVIDRKLKWAWTGKKGGKAITFYYLFFDGLFHHWMLENTCDYSFKKMSFLVHVTV